MVGAVVAVEVVPPREDKVNHIPDFVAGAKVVAEVVDLPSTAAGQHLVQATVTGVESSGEECLREARHYRSRSLSKSEA